LQCIEDIHKGRYQFVMAVSGGGSGAISKLLAEPGASGSIIEALVPYSSAAMEHFLGLVPEQACSERNARAMAMAAYLRAAELGAASSDKAIAGLACTAALATNRPRRGLHQIHVALQTEKMTRSLSLNLQKGTRTREQEEALASDLIIQAMAELCEVSFKQALAKYPEEQLLQESVIAEDPVHDLFVGNSELLQLTTPPDTNNPLTIFPGAFNPLHDGHKSIAKIASRLTGHSCHLELSITNVDKLPLDYLEIDHRSKRIVSELPLLLTRAPTFIEKSGLFPGATFAVGVDTISRIADGRYYNNDRESTARALKKIRGQACKFLVFGRKTRDKFLSLDDLVLPDILAEICTGVPEQEFRIDISSTELRSKF